MKLRMTLRTRLMLLGLLALLPPLGLLAWGEVEAGRAREVAVREEALRLARLVTAEQQRIAEGAHQTLTMLSGLAASTAGFEDALCGPVLARVMTEFPRYVALGTTDREGRVRCTARPGDRGTSLTDRAYYQRALAEGGFVIGGYVFGRGSQEGSFHFAQRFTGTDGGVSGVAFAAVGLRWLNEQLGRLPLPAGAVVSITDRGGTVLARWPDPGGFVGRPANEVARSLLSLPSESVETTTGFDGVSRVFGFVPPAMTGGPLVAVGIARDSLMAAAAARWRSLALLSAMTAVALALSSLLSRQLLQAPIRRLVAATERWRDGDTAARVGSEDSGSEFGQLGAAFDRMAEATEAREQALRAAREQAERDTEALAAGEARFRAMADNIPQLAWMARPDGWIFWYNRRWFDFTGTTFEEMQGWGWRRIHHPDHVEGVVARIQQAWDTGETWEDTFPMRGRDGGYRWFLSRAEPIRDAAGHITLWFGTNTDVTDQRAALEDNARLAAIVTSSSNAIVSFDAADGHIRSWNRGAEALFGYTAAEALGGPAGLLVPPDLPDGDPTGVFARALRGETVQDHETARVAKDGTRISVAVTATRMFTPDGRLIGVSAIFQDLRARKASEERQILLVREVDHRAKNVMAVVRSLVRMSPRGFEPDVFVAKLDGRIEAMARTHSLLARQYWAGASLAELVRAELEPYGSEGGPRAVLAGPDIILRADAAQPVSMVLHELATNSAKHGALSTEGGELRLEWRLLDPGRDIHLRWTERGGAKVAGPPQRLGFGSRLVSSNVRHQLGGTVSYLWEPEGLTVDIRIPAKWAAGSRHAGTGHDLELPGRSPTEDWSQS